MTMPSETQTLLYIPGELTDAIIENVNCRPTLCACALVCRDWLPTSRRTLLRRVVLTDYSTALSFLRHVVRDTDMAMWLPSMETLCWFVADPVPELRSSVPPIWLQNPLFELAGRLHNLQNLELCVTWNLQPPHPRTYLALSQFPSLTKVTFRSCSLSSFHVLRRILVSIPSLEDLALYGVSWSRGPPDTWSQELNRRYPRDRLQLRRLTTVENCDGYMLSQFLSWLVQTSATTTLSQLDHKHGLSTLAPVPPINILSLTPWGESTRTHCAAQVVRPFEHVTRVKLSGDLEASAAYALASFKNLETLEICCDAKLRGSDYWATMVHVLEGVVSMLQRLDLHVHPVGCGTPSQDVWAEWIDGLAMLDPVFERACYERLAHLGFHQELEIFPAGERVSTVPGEDGGSRAPPPGPRWMT